MLKLIIKTFILSLPLYSLSQDIAGLWTGHLQISGNSVPYELAISITNDKLSGYSYTSFLFNGVENIGVKTIKIKKRSESISFEDEELVYDNYTTLPKRVKLLGTVTLTGNGNQLILKGSFYTRSLDYKAPNRNLFKGTIELTKQLGIAQSKLLPKLKELELLNSLSFLSSPPGLENAGTVQTKVSTVNVQEKEQTSTQKSKSSSLEKIAQKQTSIIHNTNTQIDETSVQDTLSSAIQKKTSSISEVEKSESTSISAAERNAKIFIPQFAPAAQLGVRKIEIIKTVLFESDSLVLSLYDNGEIDGDIVSVVLDGQVIIAQKALSANAIRTTVQLLNRGDSLQLIMYAENLGNISPNTGLLIIQDGVNRTEVRFAGDLQKNSAVILKRKQ